MTGEQLHERALEILDRNKYTASEYAAALQQAAAEGISYSPSQPKTETSAETERRLHEENLQLLTEFELRKAGLDVDSVTHEQLSEAQRQAEQALQEAGN
jgi:hypothetical protein